MRSLLEIKNNLTSAFSIEQAEVLSKVIYESYNELVKTSDFKELKDTVSELAEAQKRTSIEIRNLARQVGGLSEAFGVSLEDFALDLVPELLEKYWGMQILGCPREELKTEDRVIEFNIFIEGKIGEKKIIVLGEVKSHITKDEVLKFFKLVEKAKTVYIGTEVRVVFFGYRAYKEVRELIQTMGGYMIFSNSKSL